MMVSPALPSPNFSNFMLTLSPLMQLSSPQPTMSPRDDMSATGGVPSNMYVPSRGDDWRSVVYLFHAFRSIMCESARRLVLTCAISLVFRPFFFFVYRLLQYFSPSTLFN
jgi:hypothetical protein